MALGQPSGAQIVLVVSRRKSESSRPNNKQERNTLLRDASRLASRALSLGTFVPPRNPQKSIPFCLFGYEEQDEDEGRGREGQPAPPV